MRTPARLRTLVPAILAGLLITIAGFYLFGRFAGLTDASTGAAVSLPQRVVSMVKVEPFAPRPLAAVARDATAATTENVPNSQGGAPLALSAKLRSSLLSQLPGQSGNIHALRPFSRSSQLIRTATVSLEVQNMDRAVHAASGIVDGELGDIITLDYRSGSQADAAQTASMQVRVPQYRFEQAMDQLASLGKVTSRTVNAQDVSDQIVDVQARLRNLRHTEADILKIMDRYGDIEQVLRVTQELGSVREQIETLDAQLKGMQYQVAYSTITIDFSSPAAVAPQSRATAILANAWHAALASLQGLTLALLSAGLWLVAFSPYVLVLALLVVVTVRRSRMRPAAG